MWCAIVKGGGFGLIVGVGFEIDIDARCVRGLGFEL